MAQQGGIVTQREVSVSSTTDHAIDVGFFLNGKNYLVDVTSKNVQRRTDVARAAFDPFVACNEAIQRKDALYLPLLQDSEVFIAAPVETFGGQHQNFRKVISLLAPASLNLGPASAAYNARTYMAYWTQAVSVGQAKAAAEKQIELADRALAMRS
jgi:hypothetical protein